jgi:hypothetical protein
MSIKEIPMITPVSTSAPTAVYQPTADPQPQPSSSHSASGTDTVELSTAAQVVAMRQQGMSIKQIAANMGLKTSLVDTYLGVTTSSATGTAPSSSAQSQRPASESATPTAAPSVKTTTVA